MEKQKIIVCPNEEKIKLLKELNHSKSLHSIKFMNKNEFLRRYYFDYGVEAIFYLMEKYQYNIDVCKVYLENMMVIDCTKNYTSSKLNFLKELKQELIDQGYLHFDSSFSNYISDKEVEVSHYYDLDLYEEMTLHTSISIPNVDFNSQVYSFSTMEEEIVFVCSKIRELLRTGISFRNIYLGNVSSDYYYTIEKVFSYFGIPVNIPYQKSIYSTKVVQDYLKTGEIDLDNTKYSSIYQKLLTCFEKVNHLDLENKNTKDILKDLLQHTYLDVPRKRNAVNIVDIFEKSFCEDDYVFVVGFNQDILPKTVQDTQYISDKIKEEVDLYPSSYLNERMKKSTIYLLSKISHLMLSYKLSTPFASFYPSSLIEEYHLPVIHPEVDFYHYSNLYNKILLTEGLDQYFFYGVENQDLKALNSSYSIPYRTYQNQFLGINQDTYLKHLDYPLKLSYTGLNTYNECRFHYYIHSVLKLDEYTPTFAAFIGSMYHEILSLFEKSNFDFESVYNHYLESRDLSVKELVLLVRIKKDLLELLDVLKKQKLLLGYDEVYCEKKVEIPIRDDISVKFIGFIDKILFYQKVDDTYFSIIDYKTGSIDTHIEPMKYGLHMQLPIYLYLLYYSKVFTNPIFTGIYYQNILFSYPSWSLKLDKEKKERYYLKGYSTDQVDILSRFDSTFEESEVIKSMKYNPDKGFGPYSKVLDDDTVLKLVQYTKRHIEEKTEEILSGDFKIDPKVYNGENLSCRFCDARDLCFMKEKDLVYLDKVDDLSFLGGDE